MSGVFNVPLYGMNTWGSLFNSRQKLALITFADAVKQAHQLILKEGYARHRLKTFVSWLLKLFLVPSLFTSFIISYSLFIFTNT